MYDTSICVCYRVRGRIRSELVCGVCPLEMPSLLVAISRTFDHSTISLQTCFMSIILTV